MTITRGQVLQAISDSFPSEDPAMVLEILDQYGPERHERERERGQLTVLAFGWLLLRADELVE